jgi:REP element-mobilizing transposase RayT
LDNTFQPLDKSAGILIWRHNLPHWEQPGCTYFTTWRLADSIARAQREVLEEDRQNWLTKHPKPWSVREYHQYQQYFTERVEEWLDNGYGSCVLRDPALRQEVTNSLHHFDGERYVLDDFVVMPNHVHVLVKPGPGHKLSKIMHSWRSYTALQINRQTGQSGQLWMDEPFDHAVRSWEQLLYFRSYIKNNPREAGLRPGEYTLGRGIGVRR